MAISGHDDVLRTIRGMSDGQLGAGKVLDPETTSARGLSGILQPVECSASGVLMLTAHRRLSRGTSCRYRLAWYRRPSEVRWSSALAFVCCRYRRFIARAYTAFAALLQKTRARSSDRARVAHAACAALRRWYTRRRHRVPVHDVPPRRDVVGALVLILQVVRVLPDVEPEDRRACLP